MGTLIRAVVLALLCAGVLTRLHGAEPGGNAEEAWRSLVSAAEAPDTPESWAKTDPSAAETQKFLSDMAEAASRNADQARAFYEKFPKHRRAPEARLLEARQLSVAVQFGRTNRVADLQKARATLPESLTEEERYFVETGIAYRMLYLENSKTGLASLETYEKEVRRLQKLFTNSAEVNDLLLELAKAHFTRDQFDKATSLAKEIISSNAGEDLKEGAKSVIRRAGLLGKPFAIRFKSMDGREVDLEKLRGKVVMIDSWATFCVYCMQKMTELKQAYADLKGKGFEIVGINFDDDRAEVEKVVAKEKIAWPNYFDGKGWENKYSEEFKITSLPTVWLVDKKGVLRELNAQEKTRQKIEKLLAE